MLAIAIIFTAVTGDNTKDYHCASGARKHGALKSMETLSYGSKEFLRGLSSLAVLSLH